MIKLLNASVLAAVLATTATSPAGAQVRRQESATFFFSDESYSHQVGYVVRFCDGGVARGGTPTFYEREEYYGCD